MRNLTCAVAVLAVLCLAASVRGGASGGKEFTIDVFPDEFFPTSDVKFGLGDKVTKLIKNSLDDVGKCLVCQSLGKSPNLQDPCSSPNYDSASLLSKSECESFVSGAAGNRVKATIVMGLSNKQMTTDEYQWFCQHFKLWNSEMSSKCTPNDPNSRGCRTCAYILKNFYRFYGDCSPPFYTPEDTDDVSEAMLYLTYERCFKVAKNLVKNESKAIKKCKKYCDKTKKKYTQADINGTILSNQRRLDDSPIGIKLREAFSAILREKEQFERMKEYKEEFAAEPDADDGGKAVAEKVSRKLAKYNTKELEDKVLWILGTFDKEVYVETATALKKVEEMANGCKKDGDPRSKADFYTNTANSMNYIEGAVKHMNNEMHRFNEHDFQPIIATVKSLAGNKINVEETNANLREMIVDQYINDQERRFNHIIETIPILIKTNSDAAKILFDGIRVHMPDHWAQVYEVLKKLKDESAGKTLSNGQELRSLDPIFKELKSAMNAMGKNAFQKVNVDADVADMERVLDEASWADMPTGCIDPSKVYGVDGVMPLAEVLKANPVSFRDARKIHDALKMFEEVDYRIYISMFNGGLQMMLAGARDARRVRLLKGLAGDGIYDEKNSDGHFEVELFYFIYELGSAIDAYNKKIDAWTADMKRAQCTVYRGATSSYLEAVLGTLRAVSDYVEKFEGRLDEEVEGKISNMNRQLEEIGLTDKGKFCGASPEEAGVGGEDGVVGAPLRLDTDVEGTDDTGGAEVDSYGDPQ